MGRNFDVEQSSDSDAELLNNSQKSCHKKTIVSATFGVVLLVGVVAVASYHFGASSVVPDTAISNDAIKDVVSEDLVEFTPPHQACSKVAENCLPTGCCQASGMKCFNTPTPGVGKCMMPEMCAGCKEVTPHMTSVYKYPGTSFFCFSVATKNTGSTKPNHEFELLRQQKERGVSIFRCSEQAVYSDISMELVPGLWTIKVNDVNGDWHFAKRKLSGTWINTGMFFQVWKEIGRSNAWTRHDWTIKTDPDAVFFPNKLMILLQHKPVPREGLYYENCKKVEYGYFGNLEVYSRTAFGTLLGNMDQCYVDLPWKVGVQGGKWGPMGEDLFAQKCMDTRGVKKVENFFLTLDGACPADRPVGQRDNKKYVPPCEGSTAAVIAPFKKPEAYFRCMEIADQVMPQAQM